MEEQDVISCIWFGLMQCQYQMLCQYYTMITWGSIISQTFHPSRCENWKKKTVWERHFYLLHSENRYSFVLNEHMCQYHLCNGLSSPLLKLNVVINVLSVDKVLLTRSWKKPSFNPLMSVRDRNCDRKTLYGQWTVIYATVNRQPWPSRRNEQQNEGTKS